MRIIYVGNFRLPNYDAAAARVLSIGRALKAAGHEVSYLSWGGKYDEANKDSDGVFRIYGMNYTVTGEIDAYGFINKIKSRITKGNKSLTIIRQAPPDVVITYNTPHNFNRKILRLSKKLGFKLVSDITEWYDKNDLRIVDWCVNHINMTTTYRRFKNKIPISHYLSNYYHESNNLVIPALCNSSDTKWDVSDVKRGNFEGPVLIYAGNPAKKDYVHLAINAVNKLLEEGVKIRFLIVGITKENYLSRYSKLLQSPVIHEGITFCGRVSQDIVPRYYAKADYMILLRPDNRKSNAGFPTKFAESMISGTPVICNATSDLSSYLIDGVNGHLIASVDYEDVYLSLKHITQSWSAKKSSAMKMQAKQTGFKHFDFSQYITILNLFISSLE